MFHSNRLAAGAAQRNPGVATRRFAGVAACGSTLALLNAADARAGSSASFSIPNSTFDVAGGQSSSASFQLSSCVGSEIAGTSSSASYAINSGCGPVLEFIAQPLVPLATPEPIPALSATASVLLIVMIGAIGWWQLRRRASNAVRA